MTSRSSAGSTMRRSGRSRRKRTRQPARFPTVGCGRFPAELSPPAGAGTGDRAAVPGASRTWLRTSRTWLRLVIPDHASVLLVVLFVEFFVKRPEGVASRLLPAFHRRLEVPDGRPAPRHLDDERAGRARVEVGRTGRGRELGWERGVQIVEQWFHCVLAGVLVPRRVALGDLGEAGVDDEVLGGDKELVGRRHVGVAGARELGPGAGHRVVNVLHAVVHEVVLVGTEGRSQVVGDPEELSYLVVG